MLNDLPPWVQRLAPVLIGAVIGATYYLVIGCRTGSCPLTSNLYSSMGFGAVFGLLWSGGETGENSKVMTAVDESGKSTAEKSS